MADQDPNAYPAEGGVDAAPEGPRREASARFEVQGGQSSQAALRQALDPANQSLAEALRLSYRVLQVGILALVVTFLLSGFQSVKEGYTGVKTIFGRIAGSPGEEQLSPGLHPFWPYPVGELVVFEQKRTVRLDREFQPRERPNQLTKEEQLAAASDPRDLVAERDGFVLTADGDVAHLSLVADFVIDDAKDFLGRIAPEDVSEIVRKALMRGVVVAAGELKLPDLLDQRDVAAALVKDRSQEILDRMRSGVTIASVSVVDSAPPRFVENKFREVQARRVDADANRVRAQQEVAATLTATVGGGKAFEELLRMIQEYDVALAGGDLSRADTLMQAIGTRFEHEDIGGEVARIIQRAKATRSTLEAGLAKDLRRLEGLAPAFAENPRQLTRQLWLEAVQTVLSGPEVEVFTAPLGLGGFDLKFLSSQQVMQRRREADIARRKAAAEERNLLYSDYMLNSQQMNIDRAGLRLERDASGGAGRDR